MAERGNIEYKGPRLAPSPETHEAQPRLDVVVVIPCYNEWPGILRTLGSIARQEKKNPKEVLHGAVIVINNKPDDKEEVRGANMTTYATLQLIRKGYPIDVGDEDLNEDIRDIQTRNLHFEVVDAFSDPHAHAESNVGRARKIGTEQALTMLKQDEDKEGADRFEKRGPGIISTDGDSTLEAGVVEAVHRVFQDGYADAVALGLGSEMDGVDAESQEASSRHSLYWTAVFASSQSAALRAWFGSHSKLAYDMPRPSFLEQELVTMGGGYSAFTAHAYAKSGGYDETRGTREDVEVAHAIADAGGSIKSILEVYPEAYVYTQNRVSYRTDEGYGHMIGQWSPLKNDFGDVMVPRAQAKEMSHQFLKEVELLSDSSEGKAEFMKLTKKYRIQGPLGEELIAAYLAWDGSENNRGHFRVVELSRKYFAELYGSIPMSAYLDDLEESCDQTSLIMMSRLALFLDGFKALNVVNWNFFWGYGEEIFDALSEIGDQEPSQNLREVFRAVRAKEFVQQIPQTLETLKIIAYALGQKRALKSNTNRVVAFEQGDHRDIETLEELKAALQDLSEEARAVVGDILRHEMMMSVARAFSSIRFAFPDLLHAKQHQTIDVLVDSAHKRSEELWGRLGVLAGWPSSE